MRLVSRSLGFLALSFLASPGLAPADDSLRCAGGIVSVGDSKLDLLGKCGEPAFREARRDERKGFAITTAEGAARSRTTLTVEKWTYNFGPNQFVQHVTLEMGRVVSVERGSYGYDLGATPQRPSIARARCNPEAFRVGDSTFDAIARCGEPFLIEQREERRVVLVGPTEQREPVSWRTVTVERWTYDFGRQTLVRFLEFEDGKLCRIETGGYGYAE
jgi:hypothetical protein